MPKRGRTKAGGGPIGGKQLDNEDTKLEEDTKPSGKRSRASERADDSKTHSNDEIDDEEDMDEEDYEDDEEEMGAPPFVAWLEGDSNYMSVGEMHFTNANYTACEDGRPDEVTEYYVIKELTLQAEEEDEESPLVFGYAGGSPFRVLPASACVAIDLTPVVPDILPNTNGRNKTEDDSDDDSKASLICTEYNVEADTHQELLKFTRDRLSADKSIRKFSSPLQFFSDNISQAMGTKKANKAIQIFNSKVSNGLRAWWKAGESKTGWDLSSIPPNDMTMENNTLTKYYNPLMELYRDLCAFEPLSPEDSRDVIEERFEWRTCLCTYFAWAVPTHKAMLTIRSLEQPILEIGAGTGYWAWLLSTAFGVDIVAYDLPDSHGGQKHRFRHGIVGDGGVEQVSFKEHAGRALMLCWPDIVGDSASDDADRGTFGVECLRAYGGTTVIYIGELGPKVVRAAEGWGDPFPPGGSSSSAAFQDELRADYDLSERIQLPNWPPYNSHLWIWTRKKQ